MLTTWRRASVPLHYQKFGLACSSGDLSAVNSLIDEHKGTLNINYQFPPLKDTALMVAIRSDPAIHRRQTPWGNIHIVKYLISRPSIDVKIINENQEDALDLAIKFNYSDIVQMSVN